MANQADDIYKQPEDFSSGNELDDLQERLIEEALEAEQDRQAVDGRSIFTVKEVLDRKSEDARNDRNAS